MIKAKVKKVDNKLDKFTAKLRQLRNQQAQAGYFETGLKHEKSGLTYPELMELHEYGVRAESGRWKIPPRPLMAQTAHAFSKSNLKTLTKTLLKGLYGNLDASDFLNAYAQRMKQEAMKIFGNTAILKSNSPMTIGLKGRDEPLVDTGSLKEQFKYGNTIGGIQQ